MTWIEKILYHLNTNTNANKVPILVKSVIRLIDMNKDGTPTNMPVIIVAKAGVPNFG